VSAIMLDGFISPVEAIATSVAVPVGSTYLLCAFYWTDDVTSITTSHYTQTFAPENTAWKL